MKDDVYATEKRMKGMLSVALEELKVRFYNFQSILLYSCLRIFKNIFLFGLFSQKIITPLSPPQKYVYYFFSLNLGKWMNIWVKSIKNKEKRFHLPPPRKYLKSFRLPKYTPLFSFIRLVGRKICWTKSVWLEELSKILRLLKFIFIYI